MAKLTLANVVSSDNEVTKVTAINNNSDAIEAAVEKTLSRDGTSPNEMEADLDLNNNRIFNLPEAISNTEPVRKQEFDELVVLVGGGGGGGGGTPTWGAIVGTLSDQLDLQAALNNKQPLDATLTSWAAYNTNGIVTQTAPDTFTGRTITGPAAGITVTNGNGVAGNPTLGLANDLGAVEGLATTGIVRRTATDTWSAGTAVTNAEMATMAAFTFKGNNTASPSTPLDFTSTQATAILDEAIGADGVNPGTAGLVPQPLATDNLKFLRGDMTYVTIAGGGDALVANPLSQFAATTSAQLRGVLSDETGTGLAYFQGGDLGTPSGGVLTNATGLPISGIAAISANSIMGNNTGSSAIPIALTGTQVQALLPAQPTIQIFAASGTWTKPAGCKNIHVRAVAGGGGGGGATAAASQCCAASGGGSGSYGEGYYDVTGTSTVTVTIGAGGAGGVAANGTGNAGGATTFGGLLSTNGGGPGSAQASGTAAAFITSSAPAAAGTGGSINAGGSSGLHSQRVNATVFMSGAGGDSTFGGAGRGVNFAAAGTAGGAPGAGGGGASSSSATGFAGGAGAAGLVIVEEFY